MDDENNIYIGRKHVVFIDGKRYPDEQSIWANPFKIGTENRADMIERYEKYIREKTRTGEITKDQLMGLKIKPWGVGVNRRHAMEMF